MDFLSNPWAIGIGTGIISGLLVYWITNLIVHKRANKEYQQSLRAANNEILYTIRPLIVDKVLPPIQVVLSLLSSTARKYNVNQKDLYSVEVLVDDLTKEVLENPFLTSEVGMSYCTVLSSLVNEERKSVSQQTTEVKSNRKSDTTINYMSFLLASTVALITMFIFVFSDSSFLKMDTIFIRATSIVGALMISMLIMMFALKMIRTIHKRQKERLTKKDSSDIEKTTDEFTL